MKDCNVPTKLGYPKSLSASLASLDFISFTATFVCESTHIPEPSLNGILDARTFNFANNTVVLPLPGQATISLLSQQRIIFLASSLNLHPFGSNEYCAASISSSETQIIERLLFIY